MRRTLGVVAAVAVVLAGVVMAARPAAANHSVQRGAFSCALPTSSQTSFNTAVQCGAILDLGHGGSVEVRFRWSNSTFNALIYRGVTTGNLTTGSALCLEVNTSPVMRAEAFPANRTVTAGSDLLGTGVARAGSPNPVVFDWWQVTDGLPCSTSVPPPPPEEVDTPAVVCRREWVESEPGNLYVRVTAAVENPAAGATDAARVRVPWGDWVEGSSVMSQVPALDTMPEGGWRGLCEVTRTLDVTALGSMGWQDYSETRDDVEDPTTHGFLPPPTGVPTLPWVITTPKPAPIGTPLGINIPTVAGVGAAAAVGWLAGGFIAGKLGLDGGEEWYCRWNPGYRIANEGLCAKYDTVPELRTQTQLKDAGNNNVTTATATRWTYARAVAEVLIDPSRKWAGARTVVATEVPVVTPEEEAALEEAVNESPSTSSDCDLSLLEILNPFNMGRVLRCVLVELFVPDWRACGAGSNEAPWCGWQAELEQSFPFTVVAEADAAWDVIDGEWDEAYVDRCMAVDLSNVPPDTPLEVEPDYTVLRWNLPTPSASGCPAIYGGERGVAESTAADLYGWQDELRVGLVVALYGVFLFMVIRAAAPGAEKAEEVRL